MDGQAAMNMAAPSPGLTRTPSGGFEFADPARAREWRVAQALEPRIISNTQRIAMEAARRHQEQRADYAAARAARAAAASQSGGKSRRRRNKKTRKNKKTRTYHRR